MQQQEGVSDWASPPFVDELLVAGGVLQAPVSPGHELAGTLTEAGESFHRERDATSQAAFVRRESQYERPSSTDRSTF